MRAVTSVRTVKRDDESVLRPRNVLTESWPNVWRDVQEAGVEAMTVAVVVVVMTVVVVVVVGVDAEEDEEICTKIWTIS